MKQMNRKGKEKKETNTSNSYSKKAHSALNEPNFYTVGNKYVTNEIKLMTMRSFLLTLQRIMMGKGTD